MRPPAAIGGPSMEFGFGAQTVIAMFGVIITSGAVIAIIFRRHTDRASKQ